MGWLKPGYQKPPRTDYDQFLKRDEAVTASLVAHVKDIEYPFCSKDIQNEDLPFIPAEIVSSKDGKGGSKLCVSAANRSEILIDVDHSKGS